MGTSIHLHPLNAAMIVETHSPEQVVREALRDMPAMWNKLKDQLQRLMREVRKDKAVRKVPKLFEYRSHEGNNWVVAVLPQKKVMNIAPFVWYRGADNYYRAARVVEDGVCYHISHHVLAQYFARFNRTDDGLSRLKEFIQVNMAFGMEHCLDNNEVRVGVAHGYITGTWVVPQAVAQLTTFVDHGKLFPDQLEQMDRLDQQRYESLRPMANLRGGYVKPWDMPRPNV